MDKAAAKLLELGIGSPEQVHAALAQHGGDADRAAEALLAAPAPAPSPSPPSCEVLALVDLGRRCGVVHRGPPFSNETGQFPGRGRGLGVGTGAPLQFAVEREGADGSVVLRPAADSGVALEVAHRRMEVGSAVCLWGNRGHPEWVSRFRFNADGTVSPAGEERLVLGGERVGLMGLLGPTALTLVPRSDEKRRLVFGGGGVQPLVAAVAAEAAEAAARRAAHVARAAGLRGDGGFVAGLRRDGFARVPAAVAPGLLRAAKREVLRSLGAGEHGGPEGFRGKAFVQHAALTDLFNASVLQPLVAGLLGGAEAATPPPRASGAQLALRFPGDMCDPGTCDCSRERFDGVRREWHIDGLPNNFVPGVTDHWGTIKNFDALVGVLLSDVEEPMSGELCVYPGSHTALTAHFRERGLDDVRARGNEALPKGAGSDGVVGTAPTHCLGKAGDAFIANYMLAHFVAPNTAAEIRTAVYFRVHGATFDDAVSHDPRPMMDAWTNWAGLRD